MKWLQAFGTQKKLKKPEVWGYGPVLSYLSVWVEVRLKSDRLGPKIGDGQDRFQD